MNLSVLYTVSQSYIWAYASFQFALVILFAHVFYSVVRCCISSDGFDGGLGELYSRSNLIRVSSRMKPETLLELKMEMTQGSKTWRTRFKILTLCNMDKIIRKDFEIGLNTE
ncbi:hypothetical protein ZIOFF_071244 [Zingiber officinale]|uniref:Uncharacterized protein n=1 Tax=Zingiber officinale TaxID=94328 RepID=A0A8J5C993_ZINOF|nr:hypothetical protein ZIOFF_071244 [Zingiber officinale]